MSPGFYRFLADALVVFHFCFVGFVLFGGLVVLRWRWVKWLHLPAVAWGIFIELSHGLCPLTPLENRLRAWGGAATYQGGFVNHYVIPVLYPAGLTPRMQVMIACVIIGLNATAYGWLFAKWIRPRLKARRTGFAVVEATENREVAVTAPAKELGANPEPVAQVR